MDEPTDRAPKYGEAHHIEHLRWERDANMRLYYGFWVVFLGGFVYQREHPLAAHDCLHLALVVAFRCLAIFGTTINFLMQDDGILSLSSASSALLRLTQMKEEIRKTNYLEISSILEIAITEQQKGKKVEYRIKVYELLLLGTMGAFLILALGLSFL